MDLVEKYRPRTLSEIRGNRKAVDELRTWAVNWPSDKKAALLYGRPGTGKTSAAVALANDMGWQLLELNASDKRTQGIIQETAGEASKNASLLQARKLILLDEIDNLHGASDRGGAKAVTELVKKTREPVILTANELYSVSSTLRGSCKQIPFFVISEESAQKALIDIWHNEKREASRIQEVVADLMRRLEEPAHLLSNTAELAAVNADLEFLAQLSSDLGVLQEIAEAKNAVSSLTAAVEQGQLPGRSSPTLPVNDDINTLKDFVVDLGLLEKRVADAKHSLDAVDLPSIELIVKSSKGDLRSAINDLQAFIGGVAGKTGARDRAETTFSLMRSVLSDKDARRALTISYAVDETPEDLVHWIDENLPRALKGKRLARTFQVLSEADIYLGRTRKRQNYSLWKYAVELMTLGVNVSARANNEATNGVVKYSPPTHWMRLGQTRAKRSLRDGVASKIASVNHTSMSRAREEDLPLYKEQALKDPALIAAALNLNAEELSFLMDTKKDSAAVKNGLKGAEQLTTTASQLKPSKQSFATSNARILSKKQTDSSLTIQATNDSRHDVSESNKKQKKGEPGGQKYLNEF